MRRKVLLFLSLLLFSTSIFARGGYIDFEYRRFFNKNWLKIYGDERQSVRMLVDVLKDSKTGTKIIAKAKKKANEEGKTLLDVILPGNGSLTDTTLIRKFSPSNPDNVIYESRSVVYINRHHNLKDAILDLAHELTHYVYREPFNPYRTDFSFKEFLTSTVEGRGGEVDAYLVECRVLQELIGKRHVARSDCARVQNHAGHFSKRVAVKEFYKMGNHANRYWRPMKKFGITPSSIPWLSEDQAHFISSAYGLPYPLAAYEEYMNIMSKVCENDSRRLSLMSSSARRYPASKQMTFSKMKKSYDTRCSKIDL